MTKLRLGFDLDGVIVDNSSDAFVNAWGLEEFDKHEIRNKDVTLEKGPLFNLFFNLMQIKFSTDRIAIYIITARGVSSLARIMNSLKAWGVPEVDGIFLTAGESKKPFVAALDLDLFFDDKMSVVREVQDICPTVLVPYSEK